MLPPTLPLSTTSLQHFHWQASETLQRDQEQSHLLHEPKFRIMTTDPITGHEVDNYLDHCSLMDGNMSIYFETEENCKEYQNIPFDHPNRRLPYLATDDDDRGG